ncbi:hypothetical protein FH972_022061 [Carpinus fangiana]|uniref:Uncharacterized protein n=1 Tax=Carpinus fangiana TaxID=176857 RepID=A0A5N6KR55_9ROSI|nr:hypothetical protein FH972_022061 [Carpinus fangiana]
MGFVVIGRMGGREAERDWRVKTPRLHLTAKSLRKELQARVRHGAGQQVAAGQGVGRGDLARTCTGNRKQEQIERGKMAVGTRHWPSTFSGRSRSRVLGTGFVCKLDYPEAETARVLRVFEPRRARWPITCSDLQTFCRQGRL